MTIYPTPILGEAAPPVPVSGERVENSEDAQHFRVVVRLGLKLEKCMKQTVLVAGFCAAGKSTFINRLQNDRLPLRISKILPAGCKDWMMLSSTDQKLHRESELPANIIVHYDLLQTLRHGKLRLADDPILAMLLARGQVTVVDLNVDVAVLARRLAEREEFKGRLRGWPYRSWKRFLHRPLLWLVYKGGLAAIPHPVDLYTRYPRTLDKIAREWRSILEQASSSSPVLVIVKQFGEF